MSRSLSNHGPIDYILVHHCELGFLCVAAVAFIRGGGSAHVAAFITVPAGQDFGNVQSSHAVEYSVSMSKVLNLVCFVESSQEFYAYADLTGLGLIRVKDPARKVVNSFKKNTQKKPSMVH